MQIFFCNKTKEWTLLCCTVEKFDNLVDLSFSTIHVAVGSKGLVVRVSTDVEDLW